MSKRQKLSDQVRRAIEESGRSQNSICIQLDWSRSTLSRFVRGESYLSMAALDELADILDLHVVVGPPKARGRRN